MLAALRSADLSPSDWLTPGDLALILRSAYDPAVSGALERHGEVGRDLATAGPVAVTESPLGRTGPGQEHRGRETTPCALFAEAIQQLPHLPSTFLALHFRPRNPLHRSPHPPLPTRPSGRPHGLLLGKGQCQLQYVLELPHPLVERARQAVVQAVGVLYGPGGVVHVAVGAEGSHGIHIHVHTSILCYQGPRDLVLGGEVAPVVRERNQFGVLASTEGACIVGAVLMTCEGGGNECVKVTICSLLFFWGS